MTVGEFCNRDVVITNRDAAITEVAELMRKHHVGDIVVVRQAGDNNRPVGIITDRDLVVEILAPQVDPASCTAGDIMTSELLTAREGDGLWATLQRMRQKGVRRVPVIDNNGLLEGIMTMDDMLELLSDELSALSRVITREREHEQQSRN